MINELPPSPPSVTIKTKEEKRTPPKRKRERRWKNINVSLLHIHFIHTLHAKQRGDEEERNHDHHPFDITAWPTTTRRCLVVSKYTTEYLIKYYMTSRANVKYVHEVNCE